ncbi:MAG: nuclear transport factor 2 family protein [Actinomycetota bacterium]
MASDNEEVVRKGYELFGKGDLDGLGKIFTDDAVHTFPGNSQVSGEHKGRDACFAMYGKLFELSGGTFVADLQSTTAKGDTVVAEHRATGKRDGKALDVEETLTFTIKDGKIAGLETSFKPEDQPAVDEFWA